MGAPSRRAPPQSLLEAATAPVPARDPGSALAEHWHRGVFMEIFVRAWKDGNGDGIGDLRGLIDTLPYLQRLGVRGLWLMPIHPSEDGDHGYAVTDYRGIHPDYGTLADFDELLQQAHARGIGIVLDYVINHSAAAHPLFQSSRQSGRSPHRDWYLWQSRHPAGWRIYDNDPWKRDGEASYFAAFSPHMPDFNWRHPAVQAWHHDNLRFWLNRGVDGFRFDAVGHLVENGPYAWDCQPENHDIMARIRALLDGYERRFMVCEVPGDPQGFARSSGSAFAFDLSPHLIALARGDEAATAAAAAYFETAPCALSTLLSNHDSFAGARVADQLQGHTAQMRVAAAALMTLPGTPFIYYGEPVGMAGHRSLPADPALRTPMSWTDCPLTAGFSTGRPFRALSPNAGTHHVAQQLDAPDSLHRFYERLIALRHGRPSLMRGDYRVLAVQGSAWAFARTLGAQTTVVAFNGGAAPVSLTLPPGLAAGQPLLEAGRPRLQAAPSRAAAGAASLLLPAHAVWVGGEG
jgi:alpha-amylase